MKSSIIFLGLVALSFTNAKAANEFKTQDLEQQETQLVSVNQEFLNSNCEDTAANTEIFNPASVIKTTYVKTIEDVVVENKLIIESQEETVQPLSLETTIEDKIAEDNQIIESIISKEFFPLDLEKINNKIQCVKAYNNNATISVDLKL